MFSHLSIGAVILCFKSIPVVQRLDISVNVKDGNVFITGFLTFQTVAII